MNLKQMLARRAEMLDAMDADGFEMTEEFRAEMATLADGIEQARADQEAEMRLRSIVPEGETVDATGSVRAGSGTTAETREQTDEIDKRIDSALARGNGGLAFDDRVRVRAALTTAGLFGGTAVPSRDDRGVKTAPEAPLTFLDLFPSTSTDADIISYVREVPTDNSAAETAEGELKPEAEFEMEEVTHGHSVIANWITVTRQTLRSRAGIRAAIEGRLTARVRERANTQVWTGDGVGANIEGLRNAGIRTFTMDGTWATKGENVYRTIKRAKRLAAQSHFPATHVGINPEDNEALEAFLELASGRYSVGLTVVESYDQPAGSVVVGPLTNSAVLEIIYRDGMEVYASREHSDNLTKNMVTILGEQEAGLAVYFPAAVVEGTFAPAEGSEDGGDNGDGGEDGGED